MIEINVVVVIAVGVGVPLIEGLVIRAGSKCGHSCVGRCSLHIPAGHADSRLRKTILRLWLSGLRQLLVPGRGTRVRESGVRDDVDLYTCHNRILGWGSRGSFSPRSNLLEDRPFSTLPGDWCSARSSSASGFFGPFRAFPKVGL